MNKDIGLFLNGPSEWYQNISKSFRTHRKTWIQQSQVPRQPFLDQLKSLISNRGFFYAFGYVQSPYSKVMYRFKIIQIIHDISRISPPDETAPPFSDYDRTQGGCTKGKYAYPMWLKVSEIEDLEGVDKTLFINLNNERPIQSVRGNPNYVVRIPHELINERSPKTIDDVNERIKIEDYSTISITLEKDLQYFITRNIESIEEGLKIYKNGIEFQVSVGRIDLLCTDKNDNFVVIELKPGKTGIETYGQIKSYIAAIKKEIARDKQVRGLIIARDFDDKLILTASYDSDIKLLSYSVKFEFVERNR